MTVSRKAMTEEIRTFHFDNPPSQLRCQPPLHKGAIFSL